MKPQFVLLSAVMLLVFLCLPAAIVPPPVAASTDTACRAPSCRHNVLVLHSYHHGFSWDDEIDRGIVAGFDGSGRRSDIRFEYMDTKRHHDDTYRQRLLDLYRCKFAGDSFDVVITVDNNAFDFLRRQRDELFPGTPVVFCGVNNFQDDMLTGLEGFTGVVEKVDIRSTLSAAVRLHPETARVVVYGDGSPTYRANRDLLEQVIPDHVTTRKFEFFERPGLQIDAVRAHVRDLSANSLILLITTVRDHNGRLLSFEDSAALIAAAGTVPVYGCWDFFLGHGIVGGMLVSGFAQGEAAAAMAGSILDGEPVKDIPVQHASPNRFMFDYRQLQRFGIGTSHVPADSVVVNRPFSFYQVYAGRIWCAAGVFAGMILLLVFLSVTIFRRRRAERALRESEGRLQTVFDAARTVSLVITDSAGADARIREFSPGAERIFGCSRAEVLGQPVAVFHRPGDVSRFPEIVESLRQNRSGFDGETVLVRKNGEQFPALFSIHPIFGSDDRLVALLEVSIDITLLHEARKSLEASERHFRELFDSVSDLVFTHDLEGRFLTVNRAIAETFGGAPEEFIGRRVTEYMPAEFRHLFEPEYLAPLRRDGRAAGINGYLDHRGGKVYVEYHCTMVRPEDGAPYVSGIGRNVTERMRAERQLKQLRQKVLQAEKMEAIGVLAGGIAHDFNNLLMGIQGNASLMLLGRKPGDADYEKLRHIEQYVQNGAALTKQLLGFARGGKYEVKPTDLNELIRDHGRMFGRTKKEITIHERFAADLQPVEVDQGQMEQCLLNLYINAWQAMPGGGEIYVQTENVVLDERYVMPFSVPPGKYVKVTVTDTGTGMDEATRKRIFESFFTTREMGRGTGLGLASVYGIIQNHGGMINVYSEKGTGTTFTIYLPAGGRDAVTVSSPVVDMDDLLRGTETVLLVDDEPMIIEVGKGMLEVLGYRVLTAASAGEALEIYAANRERIALVILDMIMPGMGGGEAHERLKAIYPWVKTLLSSGYSLNGQAQKIIDRGCRGFIQKPFKIVELARKVREILDG